MARTFTEYDLELLGYTKIREVGPTDEVFRIFAASAAAGVKSVEHHFLYLKNEGVGGDAVARALRKARSLPDLHSVYPDKSSLSDKSKADLQRAGPVYAHAALIWARLEAVFDEYIKAIEAGVPHEEWFIQPRYADPQADAKAQLDRDIVAYLTSSDRISNANFKPGHLLVVKAPAGVGKTTLSRAVVREIARDSKKRRTIPIYVEASHWGKLQLRSVTDIWDIIRNSLTTFSSNISMRRELFEYALRQGWVSFIFDGFDELCARRHSHFNAPEVLKDLAKLVEQSEARLMLTTRSLFWDAEVGATIPANVTVCALAPFNRPQAMAYFQRRFARKQNQAKKASELYSRLAAHTHTPETPGGSRAQLINTPICVSMIAEYVDHQEEASIPDDRGGNFLNYLLLGLCRRDRKRQQFTTPPETQLKAFVNLALEDQEQFDDVDLGSLGFEQDDLASGRTIDHALLTSGHDQPYQMRYEFLQPYFKALHLCELLLGKNLTLPTSAQKLISQEANGRGYVLEHLVQLLPTPSLDQIASHARASGTGNADLKLFLFHLLRMLLDAEQPKDTASQRASFLLGTALGATKIDNRLVVRRKQISGPIEKMDLRGVRFEECIFRDVSFSRCTVDESTEFLRCEFKGDFLVSDRDAKAWRNVLLLEPSAEPPASLAISDLIGNKQLDKKTIAQDALRLGLERFWHHGQLKRSLKLDDWNRGLLATSRLAPDVLDSLLKANVVERIVISSVKGGGLGVPMSSVPDIKEFMDNSHLTGRVRAAYEDLLSRLQ
jgi:hypothetical protein